MRRAVVLAVVGGLIVASSLAVAVALPRHYCSQRSQLFKVPDRLPQDVDFGCKGLDDACCTPGWEEAPDRLRLKIGIAVGGTVLGLALGALAIRRAPRVPRSPSTLVDVGG